MKISECLEVVFPLETKKYEEQKVQTKIQQVLDTKIERDRHPQVSDGGNPASLTTSHPSL
ncbi:Uncharacterized protein DAT39_000336 [Clarias magur]|uniref:Uncharacterized protein n=1 Tax=Clarias magur TaxID=1594786 RepID=A0A8J4XHR8_CLAMG|nr:Uncharacterized protein DAT39_000336 [Clarias magur]